MSLRLILLSFIGVLFFPCYVVGKLPTAIDVAANIKKEYKGLHSFFVEVDFFTDSGVYKAYYYQKGKDVRIRWTSKNNEKYVDILSGNTYGGNILKDFPTIPISLEDFTNPYNNWESMNINTQQITYEYVDHIPCFVIGDINKIYIDIENFAVRKKIINNVEYIFRNFVHVGNYFFPTKIDIKCNGYTYRGNILWKDVNKENSRIAENINHGGSSFRVDEPPLFRCLPMAKEVLR